MKQTLRDHVRETGFRLALQHFSMIEIVDVLPPPFTEADEGAFLVDSGHMYVALSGPDPIGSVRHEAIHALRSAGCFLPGEWCALEDWAAAECIRRFNIVARYGWLYRHRFIITPGELAVLLLEEAICEGFAALRFGERPPGLAGDVVDRIERGAIALRQADADNGRRFVLRPREGIHDDEHPVR
jgi:hypothetical protein